MSDKNRFLNFPIAMLAQTIAEPKSGLRAIANYSIAEYAQHCRRDFEAAFAQAAYLARSSKGAAMPAAVQSLLDRPAVSELVGVIHEGAWGTDGYVSGTADILHDECLNHALMTASEKEAVISFVALRDAAAFFGRAITDYDAAELSAARSRQAVQDHEAEHGKTVYASIPAAYLFEALAGEPTLDELRLFRCVCAVRSLVGKKQFTGTTKDAVRARMCGCKSPAVALAMQPDHAALQDELEALASRKRFDRILTLGAVRKFYGKWGAGRRVYLSLEAKNPDVLAAMVQRRFSLLDKYRSQEQEARQCYQKGQQGGSNRGTDRGSFNNSLNKTLTKTYDKTTLGALPAKTIGDIDE